MRKSTELLQSKSSHLLTLLQPMTEFLNLSIRTVQALDLPPSVICDWNMYIERVIYFGASSECIKESEKKSAKFYATSLFFHAENNKCLCSFLSLSLLPLKKGEKDHLFQYQKALKEAHIKLKLKVSLSVRIFKPTAVWFPVIARQLGKSLDRPWSCNHFRVL